MAYEKQTWITGEVITEEKLNHIEDGIAGAGGGIDTVFVAVDQDVKTQEKTVTSSSMTCDQVLALVEANKPVVVNMTMNLLLDGANIGKFISSMFINDYNSTAAKPSAIAFSISAESNNGTMTKIVSTAVVFTQGAEMPTIISSIKSFS